MKHIKLMRVEMKAGHNHDGINSLEKTDEGKLKLNQPGETTEVFPGRIEKIELHEARV